VTTAARGLLCLAARSAPDPTRATTASAASTRLSLLRGGLAFCAS